MLTLLLPLQSLPPSDWQTPIASIQGPTSLGSGAQRLGWFWGKKKKRPSGLVSNFYKEFLLYILKFQVLQTCRDARRRWTERHHGGFYFQMLEWKASSLPSCWSPAATSSPKSSPKWTADPSRKISQLFFCLVHSKTMVPVSRSTQRLSGLKVLVFLGSRAKQTHWPLGWPSHPEAPGAPSACPPPVPSHGRGGIPLGYSLGSGVNRDQVLGTETSFSPFKQPLFMSTWIHCRPSQWPPAIASTTGLGFGGEYRSIYKGSGASKKIIKDD